MQNFFHIKIYLTKSYFSKYTRQSLALNINEGKVVSLNSRSKECCLYFNETAYLDL